MALKGFVAVAVAAAAVATPTMVITVEAEASPGARVVLWPDRPSDCPSRVCAEGGWVVTGPTLKALLAGVDKWRLGSTKKVAIDTCVAAGNAVTRKQCDDMGFQAVSQMMTVNPEWMRAHIKTNPNTRAAASGWVQGQWWQNEPG